jgi:hypothetical protein
MKVWLRTILTGLFVGSLVYVVLEEKYKRKLQKHQPVIDHEAEEEMLAKFREEVRQELREPGSLHANLQSIIARATDLRGSFKEIVEEDKESHQRITNALDELAVAAGRPDLARDPLSAEFRRAIERKKAQ